jgi:biopolymer transport protein ExbD
MSHKKIGFTHQVNESENTHGDRPWVFFMVDCFFLITQFFVLTFKFKTEEASLEQRMPPGGTKDPVLTKRSEKEPLRVHVASTSAGAVYEVMNTKVSLVDLSSKLAALVSVAGPERYSVRVSYEANTPWGDVMAVFNACKKVNLRECGFVTLHSTALPGGRV